MSQTAHCRITGGALKITNQPDNVYCAIGGSTSLTVAATGTVVTTYLYDAWGDHLHTTGSLSATVGRYNPLRYRGYVYDRETKLYYLQSRYYNPETGRFINGDGFTTTRQGLIGNNMFAYCENNPVCNRDRSGTRYIDALSVADENSESRSLMCQLQNSYTLPEGNTEFLMAFYGVNSPEDIPAMPKGAMIFVENIDSVSIGGFTKISGKTVVMDRYKYCEYYFSGFGWSFSKSIAYDTVITQGYVYGVKNVEDYCGFFAGVSANMLSDSYGRAVAPGNVYAKIVSGMSFAPPVGFSVTNYVTMQSDWIYGTANMYTVRNPYQNSPLNPSISI